MRIHVVMLSSSALRVDIDPAYSVKRSVIELQSFNWLWLGSVIKLKQTHPKILPIKHNRAFGNRTLQQSNLKPVSSGFKQGIAFKWVVYCLASISNTSTQDVTGGKEYKINNSGGVTAGFATCRVLYVWVRYMCSTNMLNSLLPTSLLKILNVLSLSVRWIVYY